MNDVEVSTINNSDVSPSTFEVKTSDVLKCWYANETNDLNGLRGLDLSNLKSTFVFEDILKQKTTSTEVLLYNNYTSAIEASNFILSISDAHENMSVVMLDNTLEIDNVINRSVFKL